MFHLLQVGDEVQFLLYTKKVDRGGGGRSDRGPRARRAQVVRLVPRSTACLQDYLQQLRADHNVGEEASIPSVTLTCLLSGARPVWQLLLSADPQLGPEVRGLLHHVLAEGLVRMRSMTRRLAGQLLELPYFAANGRLARDIQDLVRER